MKSVAPILTVVVAIVLLWYAAAVPMNTQWAKDQAARADTTLTTSELIADTWSQERPRLPAPHQVVAELWGSTGEMALKGRAFSKRSLILHTWYTLSATLLGFAIGTAAGVLLAVGWRLRQKLPVYGLSLQGGGIGMLYLTIFAAFRLHEIVPAPFAFVLLVLLTAFTGVLAVLQNSMVLAILGTVGGFLAPVLVSTGAGNHVALFSYYLLLNTAILGIACQHAVTQLAHRHRRRPAVVIVDYRTAASNIEPPRASVIAGGDERLTVRAEIQSKNRWILHL